MSRKQDIATFQVENRAFPTEWQNEKGMSPAQAKKDFLSSDLVSSKAVPVSLHINGLRNIDDRANTLTQAVFNIYS